MTCLCLLVCAVLFLVTPGDAGVFCDGLDDNVLLSNEALLDCTNTTCTFSFWLWSNSATSDRQIIQKEQEADSGETGWEIYSYTISGGNIGLRVKIRGGATADRIWAGTVAINDSTWHHFAVILQTSTTVTANNTVTVYMDGQQDAGSTSGSGTLYAPNNAAVSWCRDVPAAPDTYWHGSLDDVRVFSGALSASEIASLASGRQRQRPLPHAEQVSFPLERCAHGDPVDLVTFQDRSGNSATADPDDGANNAGMTCETINARLLPRGGVW